MPTEIQHQPRKRARSALVLAALVAGLLLAVPGARAETFCVGSAKGCSGIDTPGDGSGLQDALDQASANGESDFVRVAAGTYIPSEPGGFEVVSPAHDITIRGGGSGTTILEGSGPSAVTLNLTGNGPDSSSIQGVTLRLSPDGGTPIGLLMSGGATSSVVITAPPGLTGGQGVRLAGQSGLESTQVITPGLTGVEAIGDAGVFGSLITADVGVNATSGSLGIGGSRIEAEQVGIVSRVPSDVRDTLVHVLGGTGSEIGVVSNGAMTATQLTVAGSGDADLGVRAYKHGGGLASLTLANSIVTGFEHDVSAGADPLSSGIVSTSYSNYSGKLVSPGGSIDEGNGNLNVDPLFVDPGGGDFHLRHDSPLIDIGDDIALPGENDLDEEPRVVDGDGTGGPRVDLGAYEYNRAAPKAAIAGPDSAIAGQAIELSGAGSGDPDPGDALTYAWFFGDGVMATGATAAHAYGTPGTYAVTLQVTDPTGQQATVSKQISVQPPAGGGAGTAGGGATTDGTAPVIGRLSTARRGRAIRFRLSEPARVALRLGRVGSRRVAGRIRVNGRAGANEVRLTRRLVRTLQPGRYRVTATARDAADNLARPRVARLVLLRRAG